MSRNGSQPADDASDAGETDTTTPATAPGAAAGRLSRRAVVRRVAVPVGAALAGCTSVDFPGYRRLAVGRVAVDSNGTAWTVTVSARTGSNLYAADGARLHTEPLGNPTPDPTWRLEASVSTARVPAYVTFDSPDLRDSRVTVTYYCRTEGEYVARRATAGSGVREVCG